MPKYASQQPSVNAATQSADIDSDIDSDIAQQARVRQGPPPAGAEANFFRLFLSDSAQRILYRKNLCPALLWQ